MHTYIHTYIQARADQLRGLLEAREAAQAQAKAKQEVCSLMMMMMM